MLGVQGRGLEESNEVNRQMTLDNALAAPEHFGIAAAGLREFAARERARYAAARPQSHKVALANAAGFQDGVPLHWMLDWSVPYPMVIARAQGNCGSAPNHDPVRRSTMTPIKTSLK